MSENVLSIEPFSGLGHFRLESSINYIISEIKSKCEIYEHADFILGESFGDPIYLNLSKEGIKLRFDSVYQRLELIEIDLKLKERKNSFS